MTSAWRALRRAFVEIAAGLLYGLSALWRWRWDLAWILACTAFAAYWFTAWAFLLIDRMGY